MTTASRTASRTVGALIAAGGAGERMRSTGIAKPLLALRGASLLERNLCALLGAGLRQIWVSCRDGQDALRCEIARLAAAARRRGVAVEALVESSALGTIGAAGLLRGRVDRLLTVNADNLTTLDLAALIEHHDQSGADLTLATHDHATRLPYGAIDVDGDRVVAYREKPVSVTRIASAVCVLGPAALDLLDGRSGCTGLHELTGLLLDGGRRVLAHHHAAPWIDMNEPADLSRAGALVAAHQDRLECWAREPDLEVVGAILRDGDRVLLEHRRDVAAWDTPGGKLAPGESAATAIVRELREELAIEVAPGPELARFDQLAADGRAIRHHVFAPAFQRADVAAREGQTVEWFALARLPIDRSPVVGRSLAAIEDRG
jgi:8-oxo-dGTP pyrophosphatase MutT (NUDIX family)